ncbi:MAG: tyrosine-type recombinase/integrase [Sutterella sp.]|nr:tyrosine-type recombinase/integrase [Sutterella sp.]
MSDKPHSGILKDTSLRYDTPLKGVLPPDWAAPLAACDIQTAEDLYECAANCGAGWFRSIPGIDADMATELMNWLDRCGSGVGEVTERFYLPGRSPSLQARSVMTQSSEEGIVPLERLRVPPELSGADGLNRAPAAACSLDAGTDLEALRVWLTARASNPNTEASYRKEAERFYLWCLIERKTALSSVRAGDAALYLRWLEALGRTDEGAWASKWRIPQSRWIGPKNTPRQSAAWRPFNGPLQVASRRNAVVVVRQLFNFLKNTGYLIFSPFDQVSPKVPLLKGEGAPQAFADRSLTEDQWAEIVDRIVSLPEGWPRERMKLILMMGKSLGMRASEMLDAKAGWIVERRVGFKVRTAIEILGKGAKIRRLPVNAEQKAIIEDALAARGIAGLGAADPETPLLINLGRGRNAGGPMTRSGLYVVLRKFFDDTANAIAGERPMDAAKLRASSTHWLRHTFAVSALGEMSVNVVQAAMGHASVATTGRYLAPEEETMSEAMEKMHAL